MPHAILQEWTVTEHGTALYDAMGEAMGVRENPPEGLIVHTAGFADDGTWTIFDVWETEGHFQRFTEERLMPAIRELGANLGGGPPDRTVSYELHGFQLG